MQQPVQASGSTADELLDMVSHRSSQLGRPQLESHSGRDSFTRIFGSTWLRERKGSGDPKHWEWGFRDASTKTHTHTHKHTHTTQNTTHTHTHTHTTQMWGGKKASKHGWMAVCNKPQRGRNKAEGGLQRDGGALVKRQQHTEPRKHTAKRYTTQLWQKNPPEKSWSTD